MWTGNDMYDYGQENTTTEDDSVKASLNFLSAFVSMIIIYYGIRTWCKGFERHSLEKYFFGVFTINIYDSIEFIMKMIVDYKTSKIAGLLFIIVVLWYNTQVVYSYLVEKDDEFRFKSQRNRRFGDPNANNMKKREDSFSAINPFEDRHRK